MNDEDEDRRPLWQELLLLALPILLTEGIEVLREHLHALILNHLGKSREGDIALAFGFRWVPAPDGFQCPHCKGALERTVGLTLASPFAGSVRCTACDYKHTVCGYLGQSMIQVEPMPPGAALTYDGDPGVIDAILSDELPITGE